MRMRNRRITESRNRNFSRRRINESKKRTIDNIDYEKLANYLWEWEDATSMGNPSHNIFWDIVDELHEQRPDMDEERLYKTAAKKTKAQLDIIAEIVRKIANEKIDNGLRAAKDILDKRAEYLVSNKISR